LMQRYDKVDVSCDCKQQLLVIVEFHRGIKTLDQFVGCLRNLRIGGDLMDLSEAKSVGRVNLVACPTN